MRANWYRLGLLWFLSSNTLYLAFHQFGDGKSHVKHVKDLFNARESDLNGFGTRGICQVMDKQLYCRVY